MLETGKIAIRGGSTAVDLGAILANPAILSGEQDYHLVRYLVNAHPEAEKLRESLVTALTYDTEKGKSQYGATMTDHYAGADSPSTVYTSPYARSGAGATVALTFGDTDTQDVYVLLARKKDPARPGYLRNEYIMPSGYMDPHEPGKLDSRKPHDKNLEETAIRELREETGLDLTGIKPQLLGINSDYGVSNDPRLQTVNAFYHVGKVGSLAELPKVEPGDDVAELTWVKAKDISVHSEIGPQRFGSPASRYVVHMPGGDMPLRDDFGQAVEKAVARTRDVMTQQFKHRLAVLRAQAMQPTSPLGEEAHAQHLQQLQRIIQTGGLTHAQRSSTIVQGPRTLQ